jgi:hypothetical protein
MLHTFNQEEFERVVLFAFFFAFIKFEFTSMSLGKIGAEFGVSTGVLWLIPGLLDDLFNEHFADVLVLEEVAN